ncbi:anthranilate synthase component I family protein [Campylobacter sp. FMV-PI01]|uniref:Anthranilate synthase component 1 n=1 Tax=Campylobacter portucalensis TaxID=2608384 RepID=A0A6L5WI89_9BACT|nr:anthranilate synthase component I family protein [Campylobacter portucalensis]MSN96839.1 anthranilate synthase component I family protein [Campylobacter portucalensis]
MLFLDPIFYYRSILQDFPNSYLAEDNYQTIIGIDCNYFSGENLNQVQVFFNNCKQSTPKNFPNFAGIFGVMGYEIVYKFERLASPKKALYDFPNLYYANAKNYLHYDKISKIYSFYGDDKIYKNLKELKFNEQEKKENYFYKISTNLDNERKDFINSIKKAKEYIKSGDIFQVVLAKILEVKTNLNSLDFYERLKINNPSPYMFHFPTKFGDVVGSSPELVASIKDNEIFVAPIAGTRKRGIDANEDERLKNELLSDEKELSEHRMLIDLARNDVGKFSLPGLVRVENPLNVVFYERVMHIISEVYGKKDPKFSTFDTIKTIFPAGTLSGAPKIRAMQIINELETSSRGVYGGGLGFWHFNGDMQMAILIRSAIFCKNLKEFSVFIGAGAGIVYDSNEESEYNEILNKRDSCLKVIKELCENFNNGGENE